MSDHLKIAPGNVLRWPTPVARSWFERFVDEVSPDDNVLAVIAVGSAVRQGVPSEDLDLVVVCRDRSRFRHKPPIEVDLRTFSLDSTDREITSGHPLLGWAVQFGTPVLDRNGTWAKIRETWLGRVPLPDPLLARKRAAKVHALLDAVQEMGDDVASSELRLSYLTLLARAALAENGVFPASRPELPTQLSVAGETALSDQLRSALQERGRILSRNAG